MSSWKPCLQEKLSHRVQTPACVIRSKAQLSIIFFCSIFHAIRGEKPSSSQLNTTDTVFKIQVFDFRIDRHSSPPAVVPRKPLIEMSIKEFLCLQTVTHVFLWIIFLSFQSLQNNSLRMQKVGTFSCICDLYVVSIICTRATSEQPAANVCHPHLNAALPFGDTWMTDQKT